MSGAAFREAAAQPKLAPVQLAWANLLEGLAETSAGRRTEADAAFTKITDRGLFSTKEEDEKLAQFFLETARRMTGPTPLAPSAASALDKLNHEAIAPLLFGVKDWQLGKIDEAVALLRQFRQTTPGGRNLWIGELKPIANDLIEEFTAFQMAADRLKTANSPAEKKAALEELNGVKGKLAERARELAGKAKGP